MGLLQAKIEPLQGSLLPLSRPVFFLDKNPSSDKILLLMLTMRLQRTGRTNEPHFRVVITDRRNGVQSGKFIEIVGSYNPKAGKIELKNERINYWIKSGIQLSDTVHNFLVDNKIIEKKKISSLPKKTSVKRKAAK